MSMTPDYEYDPERALWKPNRRFFLFGLAAGIIAQVLPDVPCGLRTIYPQDVWDAIMMQFQYDMAKNGTPRIYLEASDLIYSR